MAHKNANLKLVQQQDQEKEDWKLTMAEITARVREIRSHLEKASDRLAGTQFDIMNPDMPASLDHYDELPYPAQLVERLNPCVAGYYNRLCDRLPNGDNEDDLNELKLSSAETAFAIGVLAGAMFHGASEGEVNRLERGLVHSTISHRWQVKS